MFLHLLRGDTAHPNPSFLYSTYMNEIIKARKNAVQMQFNKATQFNKEERSSIKNAVQNIHWTLDQILYRKEQIWSILDCPVYFSERVTKYFLNLILVPIITEFFCVALLSYEWY